MGAASDRLFGAAALIISLVVFVYYTAWVIIMVCRFHTVWKSNAIATAIR